MSEKDTNPDTDEAPESDLDRLEEALIGTHQAMPGTEDEVPPEDGRPPVPGHRSP